MLTVDLYDFVNYRVGNYALKQILTLEAIWTEVVSRQVIIAFACVTIPKPKTLGDGEDTASIHFHCWAKLKRHNGHT